MQRSWQYSKLIEGVKTLSYTFQATKSIFIKIILIKVASRDSGNKLEHLKYLWLFIFAGVRDTF